jgi:hypothetical protein
MFYALFGQLRSQKGLQIYALIYGKPNLSLIYPKPMPIILARSPPFQADTGPKSGYAPLHRPNKRL